MHAMNEPTDAAARVADDLLLSVFTDAAAATDRLVRDVTTTEGL